ncbi:hypothetical protein ACNKHL_13275 [Shigella flexneri]
MSFSKSVELVAKVIGHYLNIKTLSISWSHYLLQHAGIAWHGKQNLKREKL